jgi:hypothetical protein
MIVEIGLAIVHILGGFLIGFFCRGVFEDKWKEKNGV